MLHLEPSANSTMWLSECFSIFKMISSFNFDDSLRANENSDLVPTSETGMLTASITNDGF